MTTMIKVNTATVYRFFMADQTDMTQGVGNLTSGDFTFKSSRSNQTSFTTSSITTTYLGNGWYQFTTTPTTLGFTIYQIEATGAVSWRDVIHVVDELPGSLTDAQIAEIVAKIFRTTMDAIEDSSDGTAINTTNLSLYKAVMSLVGKVALISTTKRIYQTDETTTALDLTMTSGQGPASPFISQEP